ncbi:MAG: DUF4292 domain-containing protein [Bacteroidota bacterium]
MIKKSFLIFFILSLLISCKSSKVTTDENIVNLSSKRIINKHYAQNYNDKLFKAGLVIKYNGKSDIPELKASLRIAKDSVIWMSISKLGFPVGKLMITPTRVQFYEKINKSYFDGDFSFVSNILGTEFDFDKVQNLFLGEALINLKVQKFNATIQQKKYLLIPKKKNPIFDMLFWIDPINFKIVKEEFSYVENNQKLKIVYKNYSETDGLLLPNGFTIDAIGEKRNTQIDINYKNVEQVSSLKFPFTIPDNYKKYKLK